jgi:hypothetical protein
MKLTKNGLKEIIREELNEVGLPKKEVGKYRKKDDVLNAKKGRTFVTPKNKEYKFDWKKVGNKYIFIIDYKGHKMQVPEADFNRTPIDSLLSAMDKGLSVESTVIEELEKEKNDPCWSGYVQLGTKTKNGKEVPNCVPIKESTKLREVVSNVINEKLINNPDAVLKGKTIQSFKSNGYGKGYTMTLDGGLIINIRGGGAGAQNTVYITKG